jgi:nucleoside-diphosphate-sugar epimerase
MTEQQLNVLITGASGLLGRTVYKYFKEKSFQSKYPIKDSLESNNFAWNCLGLCNSRVRGDLRKLDISNFEQVESLIVEFKVNYCIVIRNKDFKLKEIILFCIAF